MVAAARVLFIAFGQVPRYIPKADLNLTLQELKIAQTVADWNPSQWSLDQAARIWLLLSFPACNREHYCQVVTQLFAAADVGESVALYQSLILLPIQNNGVFWLQRGFAVI